MSGITYLFGTGHFVYEDALTLRGPHHLSERAGGHTGRGVAGNGTQGAIRQTVARLQPLPHRLEVVRTLDGVTYVNDSASTAPVAGVAALRSFSEPMVLIAGGNSKRLDCGEFVAQAAAEAKRVVILKGNGIRRVCPTRAAAAKCGRSDPALGPFDDLRLALRQARQAAEPGDVVLLSPGFTSFGMFLNEFDRGNQFCRIVRRMRARQAHR